MIKELQSMSSRQERHEKHLSDKERKLKKETYDMLVDLRRRKGPGCYLMLQCKQLSADDIFQMSQAYRYSVEKWKILRNRINKINKQDAINIEK